MGDVLVGILLLILGGGVALLGLQLFFFMLPIWGFVAGFFVGAALITSLFGDGFLSTVTGWVIGFLVGGLFAAFSWLYWYVGAILAAASLGALLASGLMAAINVDSGWVVFIVALAGAILFAFIALTLALPVYVVLVNTALAGAFGVVAGLLLVFNQLDVDQLGFGAAWAMVEESWFWLLVWAVVGAIGIGAQMRQVQSLRLPEDRWTRAEPTRSAQPVT